MKTKLIFFTSLFTTFLSGINANANPQTCSIGQQGEAFWHGGWYPATVLATKEDGCFVTYEGYDSKSNEWVEQSHFRRLFQLGEAVKVHHRNKWYDGKIVDARKGSYKVSFKKSDRPWKEWVKPTSLRTLKMIEVSER